MTNHPQSIENVNARKQVRSQISRLEKKLERLGRQSTANMHRCHGPLDHADFQQAYDDSFGIERDYDDTLAQLEALRERLTELKGDVVL